MFDSAVPQKFASPLVKTLKVSGALPSFACNAILVEDVRPTEPYIWRGSHPLSVRRHFSGVRKFRVGAQDCYMDECSFLVVSSGEPYALGQRAGTQVKALSLFFSDALVAESQSVLRDEPEEAGKFQQHLFCQMDAIAAPTEALWDLLKREHEPLKAEELYLETLSKLLDLNEDLWQSRDRINAVNESVREEIYRRLCLAVDFARANLCRPLDIAKLAYVACMSRTHFLRCFKQAFNKSPGEAISEWRYQRAEFLLRTTEMAVAQICNEVGFNSLSSFIRGFRRYTGKNPTTYRCERLPRRFFGPL